MGKNIERIALNRLLEHPDNPNRMSSAAFGRLVRNIEQRGVYEPLVVRRHRDRRGFYQIINGHHRAKALAKLGHSEADAIVWDIDDEQTLVLLATLNRLCGSDVLDKKIALLQKLTAKRSTKELAKLLPASARQIDRLVNLEPPAAPAAVPDKPLATPVVFFLGDQQKRTLDQALTAASDSNTKTKAAALTTIAQQFLKSRA